MIVLPEALGSFCSGASKDTNIISSEHPQTAAFILSILSESMTTASAVLQPHASARTACLFCWVLSCDGAGGNKSKSVCHRHSPDLKCTLKSWLKEDGQGQSATAHKSSLRERKVFKSSQLKQTLNEELSGGEKRAAQHPADHSPPQTLLEQADESRSMILCSCMTFVEKIALELIEISFFHSLSILLSCIHSLGWNEVYLFICLWVCWFHPPHQHMTRYAPTHTHIWRHVTNFYRNYTKRCSNSFISSLFSIKLLMAYLFF